MVPYEIKVRENAMRRKAVRQELMLQKSPKRDPAALDYGLFSLQDLRTRALVNPTLFGGLSAFSWTLEQVERHFGIGKKARKPPSDEPKSVEDSRAAAR